MNKHNRIKFIPQGQPTVWASVKDRNDFSPTEQATIEQWWVDYEMSLDYDLEEELGKIRRYQMNQAKTVSPLWQKWGASHSVKSVIDFDYSSTLEVQRNLCRDQDVTITETEEMAFPGALMCCDAPEQTMAFLLRSFCDLHGLTIDERLAINTAYTKYAHLAMQAVFLGKGTLVFPRPSDYEYYKGYKNSVSKVPHPNHGSMGSGHATIGFACRKFLIEFTRRFLPHIQIQDIWIQATEEVGLARVEIGIHWFLDHEASSAMVEAFHHLFWDKVQPLMPVGFGEL